MVDGGAGASTLATGAVDRTPWRPEAETHGGPPSRWRATSSTRSARTSLTRPSSAAAHHGGRRAPGARARRGAARRRARSRPTAWASCRCERPGWDAEALARAWGGACVTIEATVLRHADERVLPDADFAARHDDDARLGWLAERLREALATVAGDTVAALVLPPSLGVERARADAALGASWGSRAARPLALPGGPPACASSARATAPSAPPASERVAGRARRVERTRARSGGGWRVTTTEDESLDADAVVLATGGLLGGGIEYAPSRGILARRVPPRSRAPLRATLDAPLRSARTAVRSSRRARSSASRPRPSRGPSSADGLLERAGVLVGEDGAALGAARPLRGGRARRRRAAHLARRPRRAALRAGRRRAATGADRCAPCACARTCQPTLSIGVVPLLRIVRDVARLAAARLGRRRARVARRRRRRSSACAGAAARLRREVPLEVLLAVRDAPVVLAASRRRRRGGRRRPGSRARSACSSARRSGASPRRPGAR